MKPTGSHPSLRHKHPSSPAHHPIFLVVVAQHREAAAVAEQRDFAERVVIDGFGDYDNWRVGGTHREFLVHATQAPLIGLKNTRTQLWVRKDIIYRMKHTHRVVFVICSICTTNCPSRSHLQGS